MAHLLKDKKAVITGGARGIGLAISTLFLKEGASVVLFGTNEQTGNEVALDLSKHLEAGQTVEFLKVDVSNGSDVEQAFKKILEKWPTIDILVNNAGITKDNLLMKLSEEEWDRVLDTNLKSIFHTCKAVIRHMMKARKGKILNISSVVGLTGNAGQTNYSASKAGMIGFSKSLAKEVGSRNICVNCIAPGFIQTDMTHGLSEAIKEQLLQKIPLQRLGHAEEIAYGALYLTSDWANYITGQVLTIDGGMTL